MHSSMTLAVMYTKPSHGDFSLLRIKSRDVTPWGLVDRPKQFGGTCYPSSSGYESSFLLTLKMEVPGCTKMLVPMCQTQPLHIPWTHNLNIFYTEITDVICIALAFRVAQHDSCDSEVCHPRCAFEHVVRW